MAHLHPELAREAEASGGEAVTETTWAGGGWWWPTILSAPPSRAPTGAGASVYRVLRMRLRANPPADVHSVERLLESLETVQLHRLTLDGEPIQGISMDAAQRDLFKSQGRWRTGVVGARCAAPPFLPPACGAGANWHTAASAWFNTDVKSLELKIA